MRLNLGCGRAQFPTTEDNPFTRHLQFLPETALDPNEKWINVDRAQLPGVDECIDIFSYPWVRSSNGSPWNNNSVDEIWASHIVEHIPHEARFSQNAASIHVAQGRLDGWYAWFYEAWRILKPGGLIHITSPVAFSNAAMGDPSHTRYITSTSFGYLSGSNSDAPFDYQIAAHFEQIGDILARPSEDIYGKLASGKITQEEMLEMGSKLNNVFDEIYICLAAVKQE
jgi:predicted SAM-dependent methyltransferase